MFVCCDNVFFSSVKKLEEHPRSSSHTSGTFICTTCDVTFPSQSGLSQHYQLGFHLEPPLAPVQPPKNTGQFHCTTCSREFTDPLALQSHVNLELHMRQLPCSDCRRLGFGSFQAIEQHRSAAHQPPPPPVQSPNVNPSEQFNCYTCSRDFHNKRALYQHYTAVHARGPSFRQNPTSPPAAIACATCNALFDTYRILEQHRITAHGNYFKRSPQSPPFPAADSPVQEFTCHMCKKTFLNRYARDQHIVSAAHSDSERKGRQRARPVVYRCNECPSTFTGRDLHTLHLANHATERLQRK